MGTKHISCIVKLHSILDRRLAVRKKIIMLCYYEWGWSEVMLNVTSSQYGRETQGSHLLGSCCLPLAASAWLSRAPSVHSCDVFNRSAALIFLPGFSKSFFLSSISSIQESTELWLLLLLLRDRTLPFPLPVCRVQGGVGQL